MVFLLVCAGESKPELNYHSFVIPFFLVFQGLSLSFIYHRILSSNFLYSQQCTTPSLDLSVTISPVLVLNVISPSELHGPVILTATGTSEP